MATKSIRFIRPLLAVSLLGLAACAKKETTTSEAPAYTTPSISGIPAAAMDAAEKAKAKVEDASKKGMEEVMDKGKDMTAGAKDMVAGAKDMAKDGVSSVTGPFADTIAKAQGLIGEKKFDQALSALDGLKGTVLSADQQKLVDGLKTQITKGMEMMKQVDGVKGLLGGAK